MTKIIVKDQLPRRQLTDIEKNQFPFALAKSLTGTAKKAQMILREETGRRFNLHGKFVENNIRVIPSKKQDVKRGIAEAAVYTDKKIVRFMVQHEPGALRSPLSSKQIAVPIYLPKPYRTASGRIKKKWRPETLLKDFKGEKGSGKARRRSKTKRAFIIRAKSGDDLIVRRVSDKRRPLQILYLLTNRVKIKKHWLFEVTVRSVAGRSFERIFNRNLMKAVKTAR